jgi:hypothetical protein
MHGQSSRLGMAVTEGIERRIVGGVDTHKDLHVVAFVDEQDRVLGTHSFATTRQRARSRSKRWRSRNGDRADDRGVRRRRRWPPAPTEGPPSCCDSGRVHPNPFSSKPMPSPQFDGFEVWDRTRLVNRHPDPYAAEHQPGARSYPSGVIF